MKYVEFVKVYEKINATTKKLEKADILGAFLKNLQGHEEWIYLLRGKVFPDYDESELGISTQTAIKAIAKAAGTTTQKITDQFKKIGDLGDIAESLIGNKKQSTLFSKVLDTNHVFSNLRRLASIEGKGTVDRKIALIVDLLSAATGLEAKYVIRTLLNDLRVGVADGIMRDSIVRMYFPGYEDKKEITEIVESALDKVNDFAEVLRLARQGRNALKNIEIIPGRPIKVMLPIKVKDLEEAFRICGKPLAVEHKYDGFRVMINYDGKKVKLFTRRLDNVTNQFPDVVKSVKKNVKAKSFVLDTEVVGYSIEKDKKKYLPFEAISQRIRRKYDIQKIIEKLPVEINVFDIVYLNGKSIIDLPYSDRRKFLEKVINEVPWKIKLSKQFVSDNEKDINKFYKSALKIGEEGIMLKKLDAPYRPGRRVGYMVKMKPDVADLDLVIVGAEHGTGKRAGALTSYYVACKGKNENEYLEVGKVSSGLKEKEEEGTTYTEMDKLLQPLIISEDKDRVLVKPKIVVSVTYQNIQVSPSYGSGFALRFPRITHYRPERGIFDIATLEDIKKEHNLMQKRRKKI